MSVQDVLIILTGAMLIGSGVVTLILLGMIRDLRLKVFKVQQSQIQLAKAVATGMSALADLAEAARKVQ